MLELLEDAQLKALNRDNVGDTTGEGTCVDGVCSDVWPVDHRGLTPRDMLLAKRVAEHRSGAEAKAGVGEGDVEDGGWRSRRVEALEALPAGCDFVEIDAHAKNASERFSEELLLRNVRESFFGDAYSQSRNQCLHARNA